MRRYVEQLLTKQSSLDEEVSAGKAEISALKDQLAAEKLRSQLQQPQQLQQGQQASASSCLECAELKRELEKLRRTYSQRDLQDDHRCEIQQQGQQQQQQQERQQQVEDDGAPTPGPASSSRAKKERRDGEGAKAAVSESDDVLEVQQRFADLTQCLDDPQVKNVFLYVRCRFCGGAASVRA